jgi:hypothetical protein
MITNPGSGELETASQRMIRLLVSLGIDNGKHAIPGAAYLAMITLTDVRETVAIAGGLVAIVCTILVSRSTIRKNNKR